METQTYPEQETFEGLLSQRALEVLEAEEKRTRLLACIRMCTENLEAIADIGSSHPWWDESIKVQSDGWHLAGHMNEFNDYLAHFAHDEETKQAIIRMHQAERRAWVRMWIFIDGLKKFENTIKEQRRITGEIQ